MKPAGVRGKKISVVGAARSGLAVAALLHKKGADVFVSDSAPHEEMKKAEAELRMLGITYEFGGNSARALQSEILVLSPGVPSEIPIVREARERGLKVVGEIEAASWFSPAQVVAVTGTNGKTTTTALLGEIFRDAHIPSAVAGNIGNAFASVVEELTTDSVVILEVSSFQLDTIETFRPKVGVLLNITPDHLDRYGNSFERYAASKCKLFENQQSGDSVVYNHDDAVVRDAVNKKLPTGVNGIPFSLGGEPGEGAYVQNNHLVITLGGRREEVIHVDSIYIRGKHNLANAMAASLAARLMGIPSSSIQSTLKTFKGVEHRLEFVREINGVTFINDSKATNVDSVWYALQSFNQPIVLLLGGRDKGNDYSRLNHFVKENVRAVVAIGESAATVERAFSKIVPVTSATSMDNAIKTALVSAQHGDLVLLSPACASFDWYDNYEQRGRVFKTIVMNL